MAKTPQTANLYEDFQLTSESKEEPENYILLVHLSDFTKDQIEITNVRSSRIVRVTGERQLAYNKWRKCNQTFQIPENCKVDKIHAKWYNGILTVTMPKETILQPQSPKEEAKTTQLEAPKLAANKPKSSKDNQQAASPKAAEYQPKHSKDQQTHATYVNEKLSEVKRDDSSKATSSNIYGGKKVEHGKSFGALTAQKVEKEPLLQEGEQRHEEITFPKAAVSTETNAMKQTNEKSEVPKAENIDQRSKKEIETPEYVTEKKEKAAGDEKKNLTAAAMKTVKEIVIEKNEDKQLLLNMGVAVLVIVALGAYVSYRIGSKSKD